MTMNSKVPISTLQRPSTVSMGKVVVNTVKDIPRKIISGLFGAGKYGHL